MGLQAYYDAFRTGYWASPDTAKCLCHGSGWALSDVDTWHKCPIHWTPDKRHPEEASDVGSSSEEETAVGTPCATSQADDLPF